MDVMYELRKLKEIWHKQ